MVSSIPTETLLEAYKQGLFPMAEHRDAEDVVWCYPKKRGILPLDGFHIPRKLKRQFCKYPYEIRIDSNFSAVMKECAAPTEQRPDSWINPIIEASYQALYDEGHAHSVECWDGEILAGGLYGVTLGSVFFGESMFCRKPNASKIALVALMIILQQGGFTLLDTQYVNDHLLQFGVKEVPANIYMHLLRQALGKDAHFTAPGSWQLFSS